MKDIGQDEKEIACKVVQKEQAWFKIASCLPGQKIAGTGDMEYIHIYIYKFFTKNLKFKFLSQ